MSNKRELIKEIGVGCHFLLQRYLYVHLKTGRCRCLDVEKPIRSTIHFKKAIENSASTVIICVCIDIYAFVATTI